MPLIFYNVCLQFEIERNVSNHLSSSTIFLVRKSRMVHIQFWLKLGHQMVAQVQFRNMAWVPCLCFKQVISFNNHRHHQNQSASPFTTTPCVEMTFTPKTDGHCRSDRNRVTKLFQTISTLRSTSN